jgi:hypothetical protein
VVKRLALRGKVAFHKTKLIVKFQFKKEEVANRIKLRVKSNLPLNFTKACTNNSMDMSIYRTSQLASKCIILFIILELEDQKITAMLTIPLLDTVVQLVKERTIPQITGVFRSINTVRVNRRWLPMFNSKQVIRHQVSLSLEVL